MKSDKRLRKEWQEGKTLGEIQVGSGRSVLAVLNAVKRRREEGP